MDIICFNEFSSKYAACKSDKLIPVREDWVAEVKGLFPKLTAVTKEAPIYIKWWFLDLVSRGGISSGATSEIFCLVSLGPASYLSYRSLARQYIPV